MTERERRLSGYCTRCGGDCFDYVVHRCPKKCPEVDSVVALKRAVDNFRSIVERRSWAAVIRKEDCAEVLLAGEQLNDALRRAYP